MTSRKAKLEWKKKKAKIRSDPKFRKKHYKNTRAYFNRIKDKLFTILNGPICSCKDKNCWHKGKCKINDKRCLQFDHIKGSGTDELAKIGAYSVYLYYSKRPGKARKLLQVLCANCNWVKKYNRKEVRKFKFLK